MNLANGSTNPADAIGVAYCNICNFESYDTSIMGDSAQRTAHIKDATDFFAAVSQRDVAGGVVCQAGRSPGRPSRDVEARPVRGHVAEDPGQARPEPEAEGGDGALRHLPRGRRLLRLEIPSAARFFGDGPRIPMVVVSPFSRGGKVVHSYNDHVSILKFIERNWHLRPLTARSRDNLPNPVAHRDDPYVPANSPAIGDLFDMFNFDHPR